jgi:hypothetical protein
MFPINALAMHPLPIFFGPFCHAFVPFFPIFNIGLTPFNFRIIEISIGSTLILVLALRLQRTNPHKASSGFSG